MINLKDKKIEWYRSNGDYDQFQKTLNDYWDNSRKLESETINDLEKHLWIVNSSAATLIIAYLQATKGTITPWQYSAACSFVLGIICLFLLKFVSAYNSSRDRLRFEDANSKFLNEEVTDYVFKNIRDNRYKVIKSLYNGLVYGSGLLFIIGLVLLLIGTWP